MVKKIKLIIGFFVGISGLAHGAIEDLSKGIFASIDTNKGNIVIQLEYKKTPNTVGNFVGLIDGTKKNNHKNGSGYYDGLKFHRVIDNFMIQGGDPKGNGTGGPGYRFDDEITDLKHDKSGTLSMANSGPNTNGSQFFITHGATPWLDGKHTVFGYVVRGMNVVNKIRQGDIMESIRIIRNGNDAVNYDENKVIVYPKNTSENNLKCRIPGWVKELGLDKQWKARHGCE